MDRNIVIDAIGDALQKGESWIGTEYLQGITVAKEGGKVKLYNEGKLEDEFYVDDGTGLLDAIQYAADLNYRYRVPKE